MAPECGIPAETLRDVARLYAKSQASIIFWGMGISQHTHGTDNARCLIALALITGQIGRPGTGLDERMVRAVTLIPGTTEFGYEPGTVVQVLGGVVVLAGVVLVTRRSAKDPVTMVPSAAAQ